MQVRSHLVGAVLTIQIALAQPPPPKAVSPSISRLQPSKVGEFWSQLGSTPLLEHPDAAGSPTLVTFLWRGDGKGSEGAECRYGFTAGH